jgi:hypothetical protein
VVEERGHGILRVRVSVIEVLERDETYEYVLVCVRNNQSRVSAALHNNAAGPQPLIDALCWAACSELPAPDGHVRRSSGETSSS